VARVKGTSGGLQGHLILKSLDFNSILGGGGPWLLRLAATSHCGETPQPPFRDAQP